MKRVSKLVMYGLVIVGMAIAIITTNFFPLASWATATNQPTQTETTTPRRLNITVNVTEPDDLKVTEGEQITKGKVIAELPIANEKELGSTPNRNNYSYH